MYKVLTFLGNQIAQIESTLNETGGDIVAQWATDTRLTLIIKLSDEAAPKKRGRPAKETVTSEE
jgi:hypothetical protein